MVAEIRDPETANLAGEVWDGRGTVGRRYQLRETKTSYLHREKNDHHRRLTTPASARVTITISSSLPPPDTAKTRNREKPNCRIPSPRLEEPKSLNRGEQLEFMEAE
ncbi:unnamed protein product [Linum trigynum]|uniref:Uncharacterized protein n=1 Tax=Linum trigynum TaxID=586398 RepID=A0AAV2E8H8_9ROSI